MTRDRGAGRRHLTFVSSNQAWGGSEELWSQTALTLARAGHVVTAYKPGVTRDNRRLRDLVEAGGTVVDLRGGPLMPGKVRTVVAMIWSLSRRLMERRMAARFRRRRPDLVLISQGLNHDGWFAAILCRRLGVPYVLLSQKASDLYWPSDGIRDELRQAYAHAAASLFVSEHNRRLTAEQLGFALPTARVVRNPVNLDGLEASGWPDARDGPRLACVARLDAREKGQDLLLRVLALPKWRARPLGVTFYGDGHNAAGLRAMAASLALDRVEFAGFTGRPGAIWRTNHALILPSRCEGLPLSVVEAMLSGRPVIATDVGGTHEAVIDGETGFLAVAATEAAIDAALETAWQRRADWPAIGTAAAAHARTLLTADPVATLAADLLAMIDERSAVGDDRSARSFVPFAGTLGHGLRRAG